LENIMARKPLTHTFRDNEAWATRQGLVTKRTVRVAKGQAGGGQFHGATNLRGTVVSQTLSAVKAS
jgi:hypothetical protein